MKTNVNMKNNVTSETAQAIKERIKLLGWRSTEQWHEDGTVTIRLETGEIVPSLALVPAIIKAAKAADMEREKTTRRAISGWNRLS